MPFFTRYRFSVVLLALLALPAWPNWLAAGLPALPGLVPAAETPAGPEAEELTAASLAEARAALEREIATTRTELTQLSAGNPDATALALTREIALLERLDAVYAEGQRIVQHATDLVAEAVEIEARIRSLRPPEVALKPPYSMAALDQLYGERDYLKQAVVTLKRDIENSETTLLEARDNAEEKDRHRRAARTAATGDDAKTQGALRLAELESRLSSETVRLGEKALKTLKLQQSLIEPKRRLLQPQFNWLRSHLSLGEDEIAGLRQQQEKRSAQLDRAIAEAQEDSEAVARVAIAAERRGGTEKNNDELESRRADRQMADLTVSVLTAQRERLAEAVQVAEQRRRVLSGALPAAELRALAEKNQEVVDQLAAERRRAASALYRSRRELQDWQGRLSRAAAAEEPSPPWMVARGQRLLAWVDLSQTSVTDIDHLRTAHSRLQEEIGGHVSLFSWRDATARVRGAVVAAWTYEVFSVQDQAVRVNTILTVLLLVIFGHRASRWTSAFLSRTLLHRMGMGTGQRAAWQTLWFYALFFGVLLIASNLFHISLTQFSVVSGALAVGIGFGSQNLISNFISGIILLIERPVSQGDVIEIDGLQVTVERLGPRSTLVRTRANTQMIVPNNRLLEQPVINWTLSDDIVRRRIAVGVAYASPTRRVAELLQGAVASMEKVRKEPVPLVVFADFGENSLLFELYFWVSLTEAYASESELRHRIAEVFAQEKIVMAFPQRDVHLETTKPLQVMIRRGPESGSLPGAELPPDR